MPVKLSRDQLVVAVGARGSGKTNLCRALCTELAKARPVLALDPWREWHEFTDDVVYSAPALADALRSGRRRVRLESSRAVDARGLLRLAYEIDDVLVILDEADIVLKTQHNVEPFQRLVHYGRHFGQALLAVARRPSQLPRDLTAQGVLFFANTREPNDRKWLRARLGDWPPELAKHHWGVHDLEGNFEIVPPEWTRAKLKAAGMGLVRR